MTDKNATPLVIKLGGAAISCSETLSAIFSAIAKYQSSAKRGIVIVHGGGCIVDDLMARLDLKPRKINGLRVTPKEDIELVAGALAGSANKVLQAQAKADGLNAVGLCLADGDLCKVSKIDDELGAVGSAEPGNPSVLNVLLAHGVLPIISSIGVTNDGQIMNVNADQAAVAVAGALDAELVMLSDVSGVLDGKGNLIKSLDKQQANSLIQGQVITDGMVVKVEASLTAAESLGRAVEVATWRYPEQLPLLFSGQSIGTQFLPE